MKRLLLILLSLWCLDAFAAEPVTFEVSVPRVVGVGETFRLEFSVNANGDDFVPPSFEGFDVLAGPSTSKNSSMQLINGSMTRTVSNSYIYVLSCPSEGEYIVGEAQIKVKGKSYKSVPVTVKAIVEDTSSPQASSTEQGSGAAEQTPKAKLSSDDILLRLTVDRTNVYKGQPVKATFKLYTRVPMNSDGQKMPSFNGFWAQRLGVDGYQWQKETLNNKIYDARVVAEYLLFPQQAGKLTIEPMEFSVIAQIVTQGHRTGDFFDDFFGGPQIQEIRRQVASKPVTVNVRELPAGAPASFTGAVGRFEMNTTPPENHITANSAATYIVKISGTGNLSLIQSPQVDLPSSFEAYNIKTTESIQTTQQGVSGYRQFEYPMIARADGEYTIPPVEFSYFNPQTARYETLRSSEVEIVVEPDADAADGMPSRGLVSGIAKEDIKFLGRDIRFIHIGSPNLVRRGELFLFGGYYFLIIIALLAGFAFLYVTLRNRIEQMRNAALVKGKRANKVALQRFRAAERYMKEQNAKGFYEEMLKALWGYMGDKLNIPVANLTKESVREELRRRGIESTDAERYITIITDCEYAQYAPAGSGRMNEEYLAGVEIVSKLESVINK
ncbi:MAG: BatD family protein [Tidjanibacter sp.]|nr:BatD family protein [Tidjanibacter sp.]